MCAPCGRCLLDDWACATQPPELTQLVPVGHTPQAIAAGEGEGALDEEIGVAVEFEESEEEEGEEALREVVVSCRAWIT